MLLIPTGACEGFVDGADVDPRGWRSSVGFRDQPDHSHVCVEFRGSGLSELTRLTIPASAIQE